jgi:hypothetical protein
LEFEDMSRLQPTQDGRTSYDTETGAVRSFFGAELLEAPIERDLVPAEKIPSEKTDNFLRINEDLFRLENISLEKTDLQEGSATQSVRYKQKHKGVPVYGAQLVVGLRKQDGRIISAVNDIDYGIPDTLTPDSSNISADEVVALVHQRFDTRFQTLEVGKPDLYVYRHLATEPVEPPYGSPPIRDEMLKLGTGTVGQVYLVWQLTLDTRKPDGNWEMLVDATNGELVAVKDRRFYATRQGYVFWPDPIRSSQNDNLSWSTDESILNAEQVEVTLENLDNPIGNKYKLNGKWVKNVEKEAPIFAPPETTDHFKYGAKDRKFLNVMAYYYLDRLIEHLRSFGIPKYNNTVTVPIEVDPQGLSSADNSWFVSSRPYIAYGEGGVPDASDPGVILHEYGHALHYYLLGNHNNSGYEEGLNDFLAACWLDRFNEHQFQREEAMPWDQHYKAGTSEHWGSTRRMNLTERFDDSGFSSYDFYFKGDVFATALWEIFLNIGGSSSNADTRKVAADTILHMYMEMLVLIQKNNPPEDLVKGLIQVDTALTGGNYKDVIRDAFLRRGLWFGNYGAFSVRPIAAKCLKKYPPLSLKRDIYSSGDPQNPSLRKQLELITSRCSI